MNRALGDVCELAAGRVVFGGADALAPGPGVASGKAGCPRVGWSVPVLLGPCSAALGVGSLRRTSPCWGEAGGADAVAEGPAPARHRCLRSRSLFQLTAVTARFLFSIPIWLPLDLGAQLWLLPPTPRPRVIPAQPERAQEPHCAERRASSACLVPSGGRTGTNLRSCPAPHPREWLQCWGTDRGGASSAAGSVVFPPAGVGLAIKRALTVTVARGAAPGSSFLQGQDGRGPPWFLQVTTVRVEPRQTSPVLPLVLPGVGQARCSGGFVTKPWDTCVVSCDLGLFSAAPRPPLRPRSPTSPPPSAPHLPAGLDFTPMATQSHVR